MYEELRELNDLIKRKQERIDELRTMAMSLSAPIGSIHVQTTHEDRLANLMCKIVIAENELDEMIDDFADKKRKAQNEIFMLPNQDWQDIMYMHYIEFKPMEEIAKIKKKSVGSMYAKNNRAIKHLKKQLT